MATRTFLSPSDLQEAKNILKAPLATPTGQVLLDHNLTAALDFSSWLSLVIENQLREVDGWEASAPIAIGSWGRGELCPGSDLDVVFCGDDKAIQKVVHHVEGLGMKFRYRVPDDPSDWTKNVEVLESNALFNAKAFTQEGAEKLQEQKNKILKRKGQFRRQLLKAIMLERKERFKRYDSIANFLEPNLKFGSGGLRDLHQGLMLREWFSERFSEDEYAFKVLDYYKCLFLLIRQRLHLTNTHDILTAPDQLEISRWFGFDRQRDFMGQVQKGLSRVSFYSEWVSERCTLTKKELGQVAKRNPSSYQDCLRLLKKDTSLQTQVAIRQKLHASKGFRSEKATKAAKGKVLKKLLDIKQEDAVTIAGFRSQMVSHLIPNFTKVIGLVQHDQYHRYSVDSHLLQAVREVQRIYLHPKLLGRLEFYGEKLKLKDWNILRWAALYHDIAKGRQGDHSQVGKDITVKDLRAFGFSKDFYQEVAWLVENHLILSTAAFRKNPQSPKTWESLFSKGVRGQRLYRLAVFTVIDILATNPEAWNSWKENLLCEMVDILCNPNQERHYEFSQRIKRKGLDVPESFINNLDPSLIESISYNRLLNDFSKVLEGQELAPLVIRDRKNRVWVRFHNEKDEPGLVLNFTQRLTSAGCNIRQAHIHTDSKMGVYDWFCVKTKKEIRVLKKQLLHNISVNKIYSSEFSHIDLIAVENDEWVFSFRAKDKKGLLLTAIQALYRNGLQIQWAKVHTWGRQIDDIFGVVPKKGESPEQILNNLTESIQKSELEIL